MTPAQAQGAVGVVGTLAALGLFLPSIDKVWQESPSNGDAVERLRMGEAVYLATALAVTSLAAYGQQSAAPLVFGMGIALLIVAVQEHALRHRES